MPSPELLLPFAALPLSNALTILPSTTETTVPTTADNKSLLSSSTSTANANNDARGQANDTTVTLSQDNLRHGAAAEMRNKPILCTLLTKVGLLDA